jgi:RHS repeat-associated protein
LSTWTAPAGVTLNLAYGGSPARLTSVTNSLGRSLTLSYSADLLTQVSDDTGRSVSYAYDSAGNLVGCTDPLGKVTSYAYDLPGQLARIFYPASPAPVVTNAYDSLGRVQTQANANGAAWRYFFAGTRGEEVDPYGTRHVLYYSSRGKTRLDIQDYGGLRLVTSMAYDGLDRLSATTLPEGGSISYAYDASVNPWANNVASVTRNPKPGSPLAPTSTSYLYDPVFNKPTRIIDALGRVTLVVYDSWTGNPASVTADVGMGHFNAQTKITYNALGLPTSMTDPMGTVSRYAYDSFGNRLTATADAGTGRLNLTTSYAYNARGDLVSVTDPRGNVATGTYDDARRLITATSPPSSAAPSGLVFTNSYDANGRLLRVRQSSGGSTLRAVSATYTPTGKVATATDANGNVTAYAYDLLDRQAGVTDAMGRTTQLAYDALSRPYRTYNPAIQAGPLLQQTYSADGRLATLSDANGNTTGFAYDGFDRLATTIYPLASTETFTYDALDNLLSRTTRAGATIAFGYDTLNRLTTKTAAASPALCSDPPSATPTTRYTYDLSGRLTGVCDNGAAITPAAPGGGTVAYGTTYAYDALNRLAGATWDPAPTATAPAAGTLLAVGHAYNKVNQRTGQTVSDNTWLGYPPASPGTTAYTANPLNQYTAVGGVSPTYDGNGNLTADGTYTLGYDVENRLVSASGAGNTATYAFDAQGRHKSRTVNGTTTISVTDADNREVLEYDGGTGAILRWYSYALGPNALLNQMDVAAGTRATLLPDQLGSIIASFASTSGALTKFSYQPYGASAAAAMPFGYTGQRFDQETGLYYYRARHYSTVFGRFLQPDPVGYSAGSHLYAYVHNDPLNFLDPFGLNDQPKVNPDLFNPESGADIQYLIENCRNCALVTGGIGLGVTLGIPAGAAISTAVTRAGAAALSQRAQTIQNVLDPIAQAQRTTAALRTDAETIIGGGVRDLTPAQRAALQSGEIAARLPGEHAEVTVLTAAQEAGLVPRLLATTRTICPVCASYIESLGGRLTSPTTATFPPP